MWRRGGRTTEHFGLRPAGRSRSRALGASFLESFSKELIAASAVHELLSGRAGRVPEKQNSS